MTFEQIWYSQVWKSKCLETKLFEMGKKKDFVKIFLPNVIKLWLIEIYRIFFRFFESWLRKISNQTACRLSSSWSDCCHSFDLRFSVFHRKRLREVWWWSFMFGQHMCVTLLEKKAKYLHHQMSYWLSQSSDESFFFFFG